jgi:signal transduction histidine kinase/ligand-binding sensor domain-containing protein
MMKARPALASVPLLTARGLVSLVLGACAFPQSIRPPDTPNPSLFQLQHTSWTERDGAPPTINDIAQAPDGALWLGSGEGLYRFDGFTFERVREIDEDSPAPTEVYTLLATAEGDLWIGTSFNGAILLRNGVAKRFPKFEGIPLNTTVWGFVKDLDGTIWTATASGLQRFDGSQFRSVGKAWGVPEMVGYSIQIDSDGTIWAQAAGHSFFRLKRGLRHFERLAGLPPENLPFGQAPSGEYWAGTSSGVCPLAEVLDGTVGRHCLGHGDWSASSPFSDYYSILTFDRRGNLWTRSVEGGGLRRLDAAAFRDGLQSGRPEGKVESFNKRDGLTSDVILSIFRDRREGSIWVGTDHGLDHFREPSFLPAFPKPGVASFGIQAQKGGDVWIGSIDKGGLWTGSPEGKTARIAVPDNSIQSLYETHRGTLWFASYAPMTIGSINDPVPNLQKDRPEERIIRLPLTPELQSQVAVQSIAEDRAGAVWASFIPYGLASWAGGHWTRNGGLTGLPEAWAVILSTGADGKLWAGYLNGEVALIDGTSVRKFSAKDGLSIGPVAAILSGRSDCWLGGVNGLVRFDGQRFHRLSEANNRPFSGITGIAEARNGDLWLNAWDGVRRIKSAELREAEKNPAYAVRSDLYDLTDGLPSVPQRIRPFPTAVSALDGRIWFGLRAGVVSVDPEDPRLSTPAPPVSVVRAIADGKTFSTATNALLAARTKNLEIDYTAVSLNRASRVRFRYKLEGIDEGWQNAGARRQAFYSNLSPGKYRFEVSASNGDNLWSEAGGTMNLEVPPAFNQTTWFRSLCVLAAMLGLWGILRLRIRQTVATVQAQFRERMLERERIAGDLHDTLLQGYLSASLQAHAAFGRLAEDSPARQPLSRALELMGKASEESRIALRGIRSSRLGDLELGQALARVPQELAASADVGFRVRVEGHSRSLRPVLLDDVYRIGREAIVNAFQHAGATNIEVEVEYASNRLRMLIQDNGCGMDAQMLQSGKAGHWGLKGIRERAERIGAKLNLFSNPGAGTQVVLTVPGELAFQREDVGKRRGWVYRLFRPDSGQSVQAEKRDQR